MEKETVEADDATEAAAKGAEHTGKRLEIWSATSFQTLGQKSTL